MPFAPLGNPQGLITPAGLHCELVNVGSVSTLIVTVCVTDACATEVAVSVTLSAADDGSGAGGGVYATVYFVALESVPHPLPEQLDPVSAQVTPSFLMSSARAAVYVSARVDPTSTVVPSWVPRGVVICGGIISMEIVAPEPPPHPASNAIANVRQKAAASLNRFMRPPQCASSSPLHFQEHKMIVRSGLDEFRTAASPRSCGDRRSFEYTPS